MNRLSELGPLDRAAGSLVLGLTLLIAAVIFIGSQIGVRVRADFVDAQVGPLSPLTLTFSVPVNSADVEPLLSLDISTVSEAPPLGSSQKDAPLRTGPETPSRVEWLDSTTMQFLPASPLQPDTVYEMRLGAGQVGENNELLRQDQIWRFSVRAPLIAYQAFPENRSEIWVADKAGTPPHRLVETEARIYDFDASPNGEFIIYSAYNDQGGLDLWIVNRDGRSPQKFLDCGPGRCTIPAISPDSTRVAYTREAPGLVPGEAPGAPRIHIVDVKTKQDRPLYEDAPILGYGPRWSPDGTRISSFDGLEDLIRVGSLEAGKQVLFPSVIGSYLSWSPDSNQLAFVDVEDTLNGLRTVVNIADLKTGEVTNFLGRRDAFDFSYGALAWSPVDQNQIVIGMRPLPDDPSDGLWLIDIETISGSAIAYEKGITYQEPRWDLWGNAVIFQQFLLGQAAQPQISFWESGMDSPRVVAEGLSPCWLP